VIVSYAQSAREMDFCVTNFASKLSNAMNANHLEKLERR